MKEVKQMNLQPRFTEEEMLEFLIGKWNNAGHMSPGPLGPGGPVTGSTSYRWGLGGKWLLYISCLQLPGLGGYEVHGGVTFNSRAGRHDAYAINNLGNLLVYEGEWTDDATLLFSLVHPRSQGRARVVYRKLPDGSFTMTSENAPEEGDFVPYFETGFVRS
jgi:hypothetical protein